MGKIPKHLGTLQHEGHVRQPQGVSSIDKVQIASPLGPQHTGPNPEAMTFLCPPPPPPSKGVLFPRGHRADRLTAQQMTSERGAFDEGTELRNAEGCHHLSQVKAEPRPPCVSPHSHLHPLLCSAF